jgi:hypothetical protein
MALRRRVQALSSATTARHCRLRAQQLAPARAAALHSGAGSGSSKRGGTSDGRLPPPLLGTLADCPFAHDTVVNRVPNAILARIADLAVKPFSCRPQFFIRDDH